MSNAASLSYLVAGWNLDILLIEEEELGLTAVEIKRFQMLEFSWMALIKGGFVLQHGMI